MRPEEKELRKIFEDVTTNNLKTVVAYTKDTRKIVRELEVKVQKLNDLNSQYDAKIEEMRKQLVALQAKMYAGGT